VTKSGGRRGGRTIELDYLNLKGAKVAVDLSLRHALIGEFAGHLGQVHCADASVWEGLNNALSSRFAVDEC